MIPDLSNKLSRGFYCRPVLEVAPDLLGKILIKISEKNYFAGRIVEVEAYDGAIDEAAHTFNGKTPRNEIMFGKGGYFYVYFTYGVHHCCNVVTGSKDEGQAVLIRALEPLSNISDMAFNRFSVAEPDNKQLINLTNGPGKLCKALGIDRSFNGFDLCGNEITILDDKNFGKFEFGISTRIGITRSVDLPWRFFIKDNKFISRK